MPDPEVYNHAEFELEGIPEGDFRDFVGKVPSLFPKNTELIGAVDLTDGLQNVMILLDENPLTPKQQRVKVDGILRSLSQNEILELQTVGTPKRKKIVGNMRDAYLASSILFVHNMLRENNIRMYMPEVMEETQLLWGQHQMAEFIGERRAQLIARRKLSRERELSEGEEMTIFSEATSTAIDEERENRLPTRQQTPQRGMWAEHIPDHILRTADINQLTVWFKVIRDPLAVRDFTRDGKIVWEESRIPQDAARALEYIRRVNSRSLTSTIDLEDIERDQIEEGIKAAAFYMSKYPDEYSNLYDLKKAMQELVAKDPKKYRKEEN